MTTPAPPPASSPPPWTPRPTTGGGTPRIADNPFYVLELAPDCPAVAVEREGNRLLAMIELGLVEAESYDTPFGVRVRTAEAVRHAMAQLRDPERRLVHEIWAAMDPTAPIEHCAEPSPSDADDAWPDAMRVFGWTKR